MSKSVRFGQALEARLQDTARREGVKVSESIRRAVAKHCDDVLGATLTTRLADVVGTVRSAGGRARQTGGAFRRVLRRQT